MLYRQHLSEDDRRLVASAAGSGPSFSELLGSRELEDAVFGPEDERSVSVGVTPFLVFAVAVHRTAAALETTTFVEERWAPRVRVPVFDVGALRTLVSEPARRFFLVELLASYTKVASGVAFTRTSRGLRRHRFSELDPSRMVQLLELVSAGERPGIYRRLGDLALFMLGVFPDHLPDLGTGASSERLLRISGVPGERAQDLGSEDLFELLGARWYASAVIQASTAGNPVTGSLEVAGHMSRHFHDARRVLNAVTDRYLFPYREQWFGRFAG